jgi:Flp pilus assembly protein TadG
MVQRLRDRMGERSDSGVVAVLVAILCVVLFIAAALAVDITNLVAQKQALRNTIDAAALDGAAKLPDMTLARASVGRSLANNDPKYAACATTPTAAGCPQPVFYCITPQVGSVPDLTAVAPPLGTSGSASDCKPGNVAGLANYRYSCNGTKCSVAFITGCAPTACLNPDALSVSDTKNVNFTFGPVIGKPTGSTGAVLSAGCKGSCGQDQPNPMNVVVVADRTPSMSSTDRVAMLNGIQSMLSVMHPTLQYVALGTIGKSVPRPATTKPVARACTTASANSFDSANATWVPVAFSNSYQDVNNQFSYDLTCMNQGYGGTDLTSSFKSAARYLLGYDANNLASLPARPGTPTNAIIFETDGHPQIDNIKSPAYAGTTSLSNLGDVPYNAATSAGRTTSCNAFAQVAANAKALGILVVTIGYGDAAVEDCDWTAGQPDVLAAAASPTLNGPSTANNNCATTAGRNAENSDGDYFFCAATGASADLANIFVTAIAQLSGTSHLMNLP